MKIVLCGYNWTGCKALEILLSQKHEVFVYTHESPNYTVSLAEYCEKMKVNYTLEKISVDNLPFNPDIICSIYYRNIIDDKVIDLVKGKIFNLHPSLLPDYRGCSSLVWAMINGDKFTGFTFHYIDKEIDTGNIIYQEKIEIEDFDTGLSLYYKAMFKAMYRFIEVLELVNKGFVGTKQKTSTIKNYYKRGAPFNGKIDLQWDSSQIERFIRAMNFPPLPSAYIEDLSIGTISEFKKYINGERF